jgi:hypothetical protein
VGSFVNVASTCTDSKFDNTCNLIVGVRSVTVEDVSHSPPISFSGYNDGGRTSRKNSSADLEELKISQVSQVSHSSNSATAFDLSRTIDKKPQSPGKVLGDQCSHSFLDCESNAFPTPLLNPSHVMTVGGSSEKNSEFMHAFARPTDYRVQSSQAGKNTQHKRVKQDGNWIDKLGWLTRNNSWSSLLSRVQSKEKSSNNNDYPKCADPDKIQFKQTLRLRGGVVSPCLESAQFRHHSNMPTEQKPSVHFRHSSSVSTEPAQFRHHPNMPTELDDKHISAQHVQTSARLQTYMQRDDLPKGNLVKNPATLIQPPSIVANSGGLHLRKK